MLDKSIVLKKYYKLFTYNKIFYDDIMLWTESMIVNILDLLNIT